MPDTGPSRLTGRDRDNPPRLPGRDRSEPARQADAAREAPPQPPRTDAGDEAPDEPHSRGRRWVLVGVRYVLPVVVTIGGLVVMAMGSENDLEGGASIVSAGLAIYFVNWLFRIGAAGDRDRDTEHDAREYFTRHGRWPS
jgi:hypothetical protein